MATLVGIVLAAVILGVVLYPLVRRGNSNNQPSKYMDGLGSADTLRHLLYREPVTLRNEFEAGNISLEEYDTQLSELRLQAAHLMRERSEKRTRLLEAEIQLELEVRRIRQMRDNEEADTPENYQS